MILSNGHSTNTMTPWKSELLFYFETAKLKRKKNNNKSPINNRYIPILMAQASIYWKMEHYSAIEKIFRKSVEFCSDHDSWRLNVAHVLFMQDNNKYKDAIGFYEPIVKKHYDNVGYLRLPITPPDQVIIFSSVSRFCM
jgi:hypothetical protein